jgi:lipopolysaccharide/colanic/teichoic acid biosynthesis glycosyltransferase
VDEREREQSGREPRKSHPGTRPAGLAENLPMPSPWRRLPTLVAAVAITLLAAVPMALTAFVVWRALGRPLMFRQTRAGLGMRTFIIEKFRTMRDGRDASGALLPDHLRETPATRLLRRLRLDELPQLLAVLRGDMAFVGPRPLLPETIHAFGEVGRLRCTVRPGATGWAQVSGNSRLTDAQKLALDIWYIDHRSFALDIRILLLTVVTLIRGERVEPDHIAEAETHLAARDGAGSAAAAG